MPNLPANSAARSRLLLPTATTLKLAACSASCSNREAMPPGPRIPQRIFSDVDLLRLLPQTPRPRSSGPASRKRVIRIAPQEPQPAAALSVPLHGHVELQECGSPPRHPDLGQGAVQDGGIAPPVIAERRSKEPAQRQPDHAVVRHNEDPALRVRVGDVVQAGHEAAGGLSLIHI